MLKVRIECVVGDGFAAHVTVVQSILYIPVEVVLL